MSKITPCYSVELDPLLEPSVARVKITLKWNLLFFRQVALTESQLVYHPATQRVLQSSDFRELISSTNYFGQPHILASVRKADVWWILSQKIDAEHSGEGAVAFHHLGSDDTLVQYEKLRKARTMSLEAFRKLVPELEGYWASIQEDFMKPNRHRLFTPSPTEYSREVASAIRGIIKVSDPGNVKKVCAALLSKVGERGNGLIRSDLWRVLERANLGQGQKGVIRQEVLVLPYHRNISKKDGLEMSYTSALTAQAIRETVPRLQDYAARSWKLDPDIYYAEAAIHDVANLSFAQVTRIRELREFDGNLSAVESGLREGDGVAAKIAMLQHVKFLDSQLTLHLGTKSLKRQSLLVQVLVRCGEVAAGVSYPAMEAIKPIIGPVLSLSADHLLLRIMTPRQRCLHRVGEKLVGSRLKEG